jgi:hypothetical protein
VVDYLAENYNLEKGKDLLVFEEMQPPEFLDYLSDNMNKTLLGLVFCTNYMEIELNSNFTDAMEERVEEEGDNVEYWFETWVDMLKE